MTTYPVSKPSWPLKAADVLGKTMVAAKPFVTSLVVSYLGALGLLSFVVAGFIASKLIGFIVLGVCLLVLDKAVKREGNS